MAFTVRTLWPLLLLLPWIASPLVVLPSAVFPFVTGKVIAGRLGLGIAAAVLLLARKRVERRAWPLLPPLLAWLAIAAFSATTGLHPRQSLWGGLERLGGVVELATVVLAAMLLAELEELRPGISKHLSVMLLGVGATVVIVAVFEFTNQPQWSVDGRLVSTLGNPAIAGAFASLIAVLALQLAVAANSRWRGVAALIAITSTWLVWASGSRLPLAALILGGIAVWALRAESSKRWIALVIAAIALLSLASGIEDSSAKARRLAHRQSFEALAQRPLLGHGPGSFAEVHLRSSRAEDYLGEIPVLDRAHGAIAEAASSLGAAGLIVWVWLAITAITVTWRRRKDEPWRLALLITAAPLLLFGVGDRVLAIPLLLAAMVPKTAPVSASPLPRWLLIAALVGPVSGSALRLSTIAIDLARPGDPMTMVETVASAAPWQQWPLRRLAENLGTAAEMAAASPGRAALTGELETAITATRALLAEELARHSGDSRLELAACRLERGAMQLSSPADSTRARAHLLEAQQLSPGRPEALVESIWLDLAEGRLPRARAGLRRLRADYPGFPRARRRQLREAIEDRAIIESVGAP